MVLGDTADMPSLSGYDKGRKCFVGRTYKSDIDSHGDFQEKLWDTVKGAKKRLPRRVTLLGNHEERINRAIEAQPELEGTVSYKDLQLERWYNDVVYYSGSTPGTIEIDGVHYGHFMVSGIQGRPIGGEHPANSLISKQLVSCTVGHSHILGFDIRTRADGKRVLGLVAGCYQDYDSDWAGEELCKLWWRGVIVKRGVDSGTYDVEAISLDRLRKEYG